jgi:hypothetical protein
VARARSSGVVHVVAMACYVGEVGSAEGTDHAAEGMETDASSGRRIRNPSISQIPAHRVVDAVGSFSDGDLAGYSVFSWAQYRRRAK